MLGLFVFTNGVKKLDDKKIYLEFSLNTIFEIKESSTKDMVMKINDFLEELLAGEKTASYSSAVSIVSAEDIYASYLEGIASDEVY